MRAVYLLVVIVSTYIMLSAMERPGLPPQRCDGATSPLVLPPELHELPPQSAKVRRVSPGDRQVTVLELLQTIKGGIPGRAVVSDS